MRYYKPELLAKLQSDDAGIANQADDELEALSEQYVQYFEEIKCRLPEQFLKCMTKHYFHDARILNPFWLWELAPPFENELPKEFQEFPVLVIAVELDTPPNDVLHLDYRSVRVTKVKGWETLRVLKGPCLEWLHDEIEAFADGRFVHSILLSEEVEIQLEFSDFAFSRVKPLKKTSALVKK